MQVGDLITYNRKDPRNKFSYEIGVIMGKCPLIGLENYFDILWTCGTRFSEHRKFLQLVKK